MKHVVVVYLTANVNSIKSVSLILCLRLYARKTYTQGNSCNKLLLNCIWLFSLWRQQIFLKANGKHKIYILLVLIAKQYLLYTKIFNDKNSMVHCLTYLTY